MAVDATVSVMRSSLRISTMCLSTGRIALAATVSMLLVVLGGCSASHRSLAGLARGAIDVNSGAYGGVHIGEGDDRVIASLGKPLADGSPPYITANVQPPFLPTDSGRDIVYPDLSVTSRHKRVTAITVYGVGAHTLSGLRIGEGFDLARSRMTAVCQPAHGGQQPRDPNCEVRVRPGLYLYFAGSPVSVITLSTEPVFAS
jgi:hypothetical protein